MIRSKVWSATSVVLSALIWMERYISLGYVRRFSALFAAPSAAKCAARTRCCLQYRYRFTGKGRAARWPMVCYCGAVLLAVAKRVCEAHQADFVRWFRANVTAFPVVQERLTTYLMSSDADIWLITGSPQSLVKQNLF